MRPWEVWQGWAAEVRRLVPGAGAWQQRGLAEFSLAMASAQDCGAARIAGVMPGEATVPSTTRRFERLLANDRLDVVASRATIGAAVLEQARGGTVWLALDETHQGRAPTGSRLGLLALRVLYHERAIPLTWACYRPGEAPASSARLIDALIAEVAALVPPATRVVLMTDRGLAWPSVVDRCRRVGWSFLLRAQRQARVRTPDGRVQAIGDLAPRPGTHWLGSGRAFQDAGWRDVNVVAVWRRGTDQPWLLVTDLPPTRRRCTDYRHRMDEEASFRDDKSSGFDWDHSRVRTPAHMDRLLLVLQLAVCFVLAQATFVLTHHLRSILERPDRHSLSIFSLGLRWVAWARAHFGSLSPHLLLNFP